MISEEGGELVSGIVSHGIAMRAADISLGSTLSSADHFARQFEIKADINCAFVNVA